MGSRLGLLVILFHSFARVAADPVAQALVVQVKCALPFAIKFEDDSQLLALKSHLLTLFSHLLTLDSNLLALNSHLMALDSHLLALDSHLLALDLQSSLAIEFGGSQLSLSAL